MNSNYKKVQFILFVILLANITVSVLKIIIGQQTKSTSVTADGFASMADGLSNIIAMMGVYFASKPVDDSHQYGHGKIETITGLIIGLFLAFAGFKVMLEGIEKIKHPVAPDITGVSLIVMIFTLVVNIIVAYLEHRKGKELKSSVLISDALHTKSDIYVTIGVLITLVLIKLGMPIILDPIVSLIVALIIFKTAYEVFAENTNVLIDGKAMDEEMIKQIVFKNYECVREIHKIRSRGTKNNIYIDMHVQVDPNMNVNDSHELMHKIERTIQEDINENANVIIHIEPYKIIE